MSSKRPVITVTAQSQDGPLQLEVAIPLRPRRPSVSSNARTTPAAETPGPSRIPRVTRLMALAIKFQGMVDRLEVRDYADLARLGYVTRARITQIMNLLNLAPDIQEEILGLDASVEKAVLAERQLRSISKIVPWAIQRRAWIESRSRRATVA